MTLASIVRDIVDALVGRRLDYLAMYPSVVVTQHSDGTVDITPEDSVVRGLGLQHVTVRDGETDYTLSSGDKVMLGFAGGDPGSPYVLPWDTESSAGEMYYIPGVPPAAGILFYRPPGGAWAAVSSNPATPTELRALIDTGT